MLDDRKSTKRLPKIIVIDDDPLLLRLVRGVLDKERFNVQTAETGRAGIDLVKQFRPDMVVLDQVLPDIDGPRVLAEIRQFDAQLPVVFITARGNSQTAIEAMKAGAFDYLSKPLDLERLEEQIEHALEARRLMRVPVVLGGSDSDDPLTDSLIGRSPAMQEVYKAIGRVAQQDLPVLLAGESGTGKELVARAIYQHGRRSAAPFQTVKCADLESPWLESELFGHEEAAFTGAVTRRIGKFEQCEGGVLLLDEIGQSTLALQSKLFRLLNTHEFERLGGSEAIRSNVGVIVTASQPLDQLVEEGKFRADLYYLLSSFTIQLPPLRQRSADIPLLVDHFVKRISHIARTFGEEVVRVSPEALQLLSAYSWPGNLDELQSVLRRALIETKGAVLASDYLTTALASPIEVPSVKGEAQRGDLTDWRRFVTQRVASGSEDLYAEAVMEMESQVIRRVLEATGGNQARAAKKLGITRGNLRKKVRLLGIILPSMVSLPHLDEDASAQENQRADAAGSR